MVPSVPALSSDEVCHLFEECDDGRCFLGTQLGGSFVNRQRSRIQPFRRVDSAEGDEELGATVCGIALRRDDASRLELLNRFRDGSRGDLQFVGEVTRGDRFVAVICLGDEPRDLPSQRTGASGRVPTPGQLVLRKPHPLDRFRHVEHGRRCNGRPNRRGAVDNGHPHSPPLMSASQRPNSLSSAVGTTSELDESLRGRISSPFR